MPAECSPPAMQFARFDGRAVVADFGGGLMISARARCCWAPRTGRSGWWIASPPASRTGTRPSRVVHEVATLVGQRVFGIALGYEDLIDHDTLRHDPVLGVVLGRLEARRAGCARLRASRR